MWRRNGTGLSFAEDVTVADQLRPLEVFALAALLPSPHDRHGIFIWHDRAVALKSPLVLFDQEMQQRILLAFLPA
jgi:hypothetical protein